MNDRPVFYDPQRKRWKRLRRVFDVLALLGLIVGVVFVINLLRMKPLPELLLPTVKRNYRALTNPPSPVLKSGQKKNRAPHRRTDRWSQRSERRSPGPRHPFCILRRANTKDLPNIGQGGRFGGPGDTPMPVRKIEPV